MKKIACLLLLLWFLIPFSRAQADDTELYVLTQMMEQVPPDALILLDLSGSMNWTPAGSEMYISTLQSCGSDVAYYSASGTGHTKGCTFGTTGVPIWSDTTCSGPFYMSSRTGYTTDCSRVAIAKRALFKFLDTDDGTGSGIPDGTINQSDMDYLKIRMGYMRFRDASGQETVTSTSYTSGYNRIWWPNPNSSFENSIFSEIYCHDSSSCTQSSSGSSVSIASETATGGTPVARALQEAKYYLDYTKTGDVDAACRQKFVILITDGADTFSCSKQNGSETSQYQYMGRRETVARARALANAGYYVFVIGFGSTMPDYLQNTLNWAGYYGRTKNPAQTQTTPSGYDIPDFQIYPGNIKECSTSQVKQDAIDGHYYATVYDPGELPLSGYAFIAQNEGELDAAIAAIRTFIIDLIAESTSYVAPVVPISQFQSTSSENRMYLGMFKPAKNPMWKGNIKKYGIASTTTSTSKVGDVIDANNQLAMTSDNTIKDEAQSYWSTTADGGEVEKGGVGELLKARDPNSRNIYTYLGTNTNLTDSSNAFNKSNTGITMAKLGVTSATDRDKVIDFVRGWDAWDWDLDGVTSEKRDWILGAFIHSRPVLIHYGSYDVIYAGANDGMFHAFKDSNGTTSDDGTELWAFVPPNVLTNLIKFKPAEGNVEIFVDGSPKVYVDYVYNSDGSINSVSQAILIFGERRGGEGYYALDITNPLAPQFLWSISRTEITTGTTVTSTTAYQQLGQTWSTPILGKIKNGSGTKRVAFIGGGYDTNQDSTSPAVPDSQGKAIYVVDIANGNQIWEYSTNMNYCIPSDIMPIDLNGNGVIDRLYVGNLGGEIWRFDIGDMSNTASWTGEKIFAGSGKIFYPPDVTLENDIGSGTYNMLFFGTGDREKPNDTTVVNTLYAIKDYDIHPSPFTALTESNLVDVTQNVLQSSSATQVQKTAALTALRTGGGWYIRLNQSEGTSPNPGEKCSGAAVVLGGAVYYTTFTPTPTSSATVCSLGTGSGNVYILQYQTGNAMFDLDDSSVVDVYDRSISVGAGIPSGIIIAIINGQVTGYGGVAGGVFSPQLTTRKSLSPVDWRIVF